MSKGLGFIGSKVFFPGLGKGVSGLGLKHLLDFEEILWGIFGSSLPLAVVVSWGGILRAKGSHAVTNRLSARSLRLQVQARVSLLGLTRGEQRRILK